MQANIMRCFLLTTFDILSSLHMFSEKLYLNMWNCLVLGEIPVHVPFFHNGYNLWNQNDSVVFASNSFMLNVAEMLIELSQMM